MLLRFLTTCNLQEIIFRHWRWRQRVHPKRWHPRGRSRCVRHEFVSTSN